MSARFQLFTAVFITGVMVTAAADQPTTGEQPSQIKGRTFVPDAGYTRTVKEEQLRRELDAQRSVQGVADPAAARESGSSGYIVKPTLHRRPNGAPTSSLVLRQMAQYSWNSMGMPTYGLNPPFGAFNFDGFGLIARSASCRSLTSSSRSAALISRTSLWNGLLLDRG